MAQPQRESFSHAIEGAQRQVDTAACLGIMRRGSATFFWAGRALPRALRADVAAIYAFCREADDAIDLTDGLTNGPADGGSDGRPGDAAARAWVPGAPERALADLRRRLAAIAQAPPHAPLPTATCRALARTLRARKLSVRPLEALLEGFAWDAGHRRYRTLADTLGYAARAAGSVGVLMAQLMGARAPWALARAADLGTAMQLTNICRDVGEDARLGRVYLPARWLAAAGVAPETLGTRPSFTPALGQVVRRLLLLAERLYARAQWGLAALPGGPRLAVATALQFYRDIGRSIRQNGYDSVTQRAYVTLPRKAWLCGGALGQALLPPGRRALGPAGTPGGLAGRPALQSNQFLLGCVAARPAHTGAAAR